MFKGDQNFAVGLFVSIAITAFIVFVIWLTGRSGVEEMNRYTLLFHKDISGLAVGGPVKYMGMNIGSVVQMKLERNENIQVRVDIDIISSTPVDSGTFASLALQGITGVAVVNLASEPGKHPPLEIQPGRDLPVIPVKVVGFSAIMSTMPEIMTKMDHLLSQAGKILSEENTQTIGNALTDVQSLTSALADNRDSLAALPGGMEDTLSEVRSAVEQLRGVLSELQPDLNSSLDHIREGSENLARLTGRLDALLLGNEDEVNRFMRDGLGEVPALMQEARGTLRELEKLIAELKDDPSQLIHRPSGYEED